MLVARLKLAVWRSQKRLMQSFLGFLHWQVRPLGVVCPLATGAYCWVNREQAGHTPVAVMESLAVLQTMAAEPWRAPLPGVPTLCLELGLHRLDPVLLGRWWEGPAILPTVGSGRAAAGLPLIGLPETPKNRLLSRMNCHVHHQRKAPAQAPI